MKTTMKMSDAMLDRGLSLSACSMYIEIEPLHSSSQLSRMHWDAITPL